MAALAKLCSNHEMDLASHWQELSTRRVYRADPHINYIRLIKTITQIQMTKMHLGT